ncbi:GPI transamidase subunit PIG-U [Phlyctochytrium arcticum]|nr:GPI transamidase subunit PIG-U [Phlyctochytrium arcticum]
MGAKKEVEVDYSRLDEQAFDKDEDAVVHIPLWVGVVVRLFLFFGTDASLFFQNRVETTTAVTSWKRLQEGLYLFRHGLPPYEGGVYHQAPLFLLIFHLLPPVLIPMLYTFVDYQIAKALTSIAGFKRDVQKQEVWKDPIPVISDEPQVPVADKNMLEEEDNSSDENVEAEATIARPMQPLPEHLPHATETTPAKDSDGNIIPPWLIDDPASLHAISQETFPETVRDPTKPMDVPIHPVDIGSLYLLNPFSIATCLSQSTLVFASLAVVISIEYAIRGKRIISMMAIAVAAYLSIYHIMMAAPAILLLAARPGTTVISECRRSLPLLFSYLCCLLVVSYALVGSWQFLRATYGTILFVPDLTPTIGLYWYFFIEMFDQFRTFFICVFQMLAFVFVIPLSLVFKNHPLFIVFILAAIIAIFKSYPSLGDTALYLAFLSMHRELFKYMRNSFLVFSSLFFCCVLGPLFYFLWLYAGSGNANFFYAITLVFALAQIILVTDAAFALTRREWDRLNPDARVKGLELIHK